MQNLKKYHRTEIFDMLTKQKQGVKKNTNAACRAFIPQKGAKRLL